MVAALRIPHIRIGAVVALAVAGGLVAAVLLGRSASGSASAKPAVQPAKKAVSPRLVSAYQLQTFAASHSPSVYWAGLQATKALELTQTANGRVYVRYLTPGARAGDRRPAFLTVGTYPVKGAYESVKASAKRPGAVAFVLQKGGVAVYDRSRPTNLYLAYPGGSEQIEVYSPSAAQARRLVQRSRIRPVAESLAAVPHAPRALSPAQLEALAQAAGPIYWAGPRRGRVYEVTQTAGGRVYVRYLRRASDVGTPRADSLTVATYPEKNAFEQIRAASRRAGAVTINLERGGLAVYDQARPTSVYFAYPGAREQIEVFAPSPNAAQHLIESGLIRPVT